MRACGIMPYMSVADIAENLARVRAAIAKAASEAGRHPAEVRLIAVSKTQPAAAVAAAQAVGQRDFGENTVQDAMTKMPQFARDDIAWHFIGRLQSNKVKFIPQHFAWVHAVDSLALLQKLARASEGAGATLNILLQVNISADPAKQGLTPAALAPLLDSYLRAPSPALRLRGLMTVPALGMPPDALRRAFADLRRLCDDTRARVGLTGFDQLSMGMSDDFAAAIAEGATMVRIGQAIFGARAKKV